MFEMPALLTRASTRPNFFSVVAAASATNFSSVISPVSASAFLYCWVATGCRSISASDHPRLSSNFAV